MFHRIAINEWMNNFAVLSFAIFFVVFLAAAAWALCLPRERVRHIEQLPLEPDQQNDEPHA